MTSQRSEAHSSWWKLILTGLLAFAFGAAAIVFPANIMFGRILDVILGRAKPLSGDRRRRLARARGAGGDRWPLKPVRCRHD